MASVRHHIFAQGGYFQHLVVNNNADGAELNTDGNGFEPFFRTGFDQFIG